VWHALAVAVVQSPLPAPPASVWPTTVMGWFALVGSATALATAIWTAHRAGVDRARKEEKDAARIAALEERHDVRMAALDERMNAFHGAVDAQLNGFGARIERAETASAEDRVTVNGVLQALIEERTHRQHVGEALKRIEATLADVSRAVMHR
jgi:hypothetical protein